MKLLTDAKLISLLSRKNIDQLDLGELEAVSKLTLAVESNVSYVAEKLNEWALTEYEDIDIDELSCQLQNLAETLRLAITQLNLSVEAQSILTS